MFHHLSLDWMFCITKDIRTLLCCCSMKTKFLLLLLCFPPKWTFITFSGCNNNYNSYLWLSNVHEMLPSSTFLVVSLTRQRKGPDASWVDPWGQTEGRGVSDDPRAVPLLVLMTLRRGSGVRPAGTRTSPEGHEDRVTEGGRQHVLGWHWGEWGGSTVADTCLRTVKEQIYMQAALNQTCIPSLTQYTQTHKLAHT